MHTRSLRALLILSALALLGLHACSGDDNAPPASSSPACEPDSRSCLDMFNARICRPDGSGFDYLTCTDGNLCNGGTCLPPGANNSTVNNSTPNNAQNNNPNNSNNNPNNSNNNPNNSNNNPNNSNNSQQNNNPNNASCTPFVRECVGTTGFRVCNPNGDGYDMGTCAPGEDCQGGFCGGSQGDPNTCVGGSTICLDATTVRVCRQDGTGWDNVPCDFGQFCDDRDPNNLRCRELTNCTDGDGDGYGEGADCLAADCNDADYNINPSGLERCGNNVDEDCDTFDAPCTCDPVAQDCPGDQLKCSLNRQLTFECRPNGILGEGTPCGGIPDNCERGTVCLGSDDDSTCRRICDPDSGQGCLGGAVCGSTLQGQPGVGLCVGFTRCDPVDTPTACGAGEHCRPYTNRDAGCFDGGGNIAENGTCNPNDDQCAPGLLCITIQNEGSVCKGWCKVGRGNTDCERWQGEACNGIEYNFTFLNRTEEITAFGFCD